MAANNNGAHLLTDGAPPGKSSARSKSIKSFPTLLRKEADKTAATPLPFSVDNASISELYHRFEVKDDDLLLPPQIAVEIIGKKVNAPFANRNAITLLTGKAKAGKSRTLALITASLITGRLIQGVIQGHHYEGKNGVLYFDTEQSEYHVQQLKKRILRVAGVQKAPNFRVFELRPERNDNKRKVIEKIIYDESNANVGAIIIDGVRDLIFDINSPEEASILVADLLRWADNLNIAIIVVLHQNKNDNNARGHAGSELKNKADVIANLIKDSAEGTFLVKPEDCRDIEFEPFAFNVAEDGMPLLLKEYTLSADDQNSMPGRRKKITPQEVQESIHREIINEALRNLDFPTLSEALSAFEVALSRHNIDLGTGKLKAWIAYLVQMGYLSKGLVPGKGKGQPVYYQVR